jgi:hypothetical protein
MWLAVAVLLSVQDDLSHLPPVRKVTLNLDGVTVPEAARAFTKASGIVVGINEGRRSGEFDARRFSVDLKGEPFFDALEKLCAAHGEMSFVFGETMALYLQPEAPEQRGRWTPGPFLVSLKRCTEELYADFVTTRRKCEVDLTIGWQPDLRVLSQGPIFADRLEDDTGADLLGGVTVADTRPRWTEHSGGVIERRLEFPLAGRGAKSVTVGGWMELEVPEKMFDVRLALKDGQAAGDFGGYAVEAVWKGEGVFRYRVRMPKESRVEPLLLDPQVWFNEAGEERTEILGWVYRPVVQKVDVGFEMQVKMKRSPDGATLRIAEGRRRIRVPFELKDLPLPR